MNDKERLKLLKKRNEKLSLELNNAIQKINSLTQKDESQKEELINLIKQLKIIETEWNCLLKELEGYKIQYEKLIGDLKVIKKNFKIPWYKKFLIK